MGNTGQTTLFYTNPKSVLIEMDFTLRNPNYGGQCTIRVCYKNSSKVIDRKSKVISECATMKNSNKNSSKLKM